MTGAPKPYRANQPVTIDAFAVVAIRRAGVPTPLTWSPSWTCKAVQTERRSSSCSTCRPPNPQGAPTSDPARASAGIRPSDNPRHPTRALAEDTDAGCMTFAGIGPIDVRTGR